MRQRRIEPRRFAGRLIDPGVAACIEKAYSPFADFPHRPRPSHLSTGQRHIIIPTSRVEDERARFQPGHHYFAKRPGIESALNTPSIEVGPRCIAQGLVIHFRGPPGAGPQDWRPDAPAQSFIGQEVS